jgi:hypothetical protein
MTFDVRCAARLTSASEDEQCQLYVGHDGEHAVLVTRDHQRTLVCWTSGEVRSEPFGATVPAQLPWAPGLPTVPVPSVPVGLDAPRPDRPARRLRSVSAVADGPGDEAAELDIA